jgi:hypothetical protein
VRVDIQQQQGAGRGVFTYILVGIFDEGGPKMVPTGVVAKNCVFCMLKKYLIF